MAFYSIFSNALKQRGNFKADASFPLELYPYISEMFLKPYNGKSPIALLLTKCDNHSEIPVRMTYVSSHLQMYLTFAHNEIPYVLHKYNIAYQHNIYEIDYMLEGKLYQIIDGKKQLCQKDDCYVQSPHVVRRELYDTDHYCASLYITPDYMKTILEPDNWRSETGIIENAGCLQSIPYYLMQKDYTNYYLKGQYKIPNYNSENRMILDNITRILFESVPAGRNVLLKGLLCRMFYLLENSGHYDITVNMKDRNSFLFARIEEVIKASCGNISRNQLSEEFNYSGDYLNEIVKRYTGMSITRYRNEISMQRAAFLLLNSSKTISEICSELGFQDRTYFYKLFREVYHITPKEFRKLNGYFID